MLKSKLEFSTIDEILQMKNGENVNVVAIATNCKSEKITRSVESKEFSKKEITLIDSSLKTIILTFWQNIAENFSFKENMLLSVHNATAKNYYSKSITGGNLDLNPQSEETTKLLKWFNTNKKRIHLQWYATNQQKQS